MLEKFSLNPENLDDELEGYYEALMLMNIPGIPDQAEILVLDAASGDGRISLSVNELGLRNIQLLLLDVAYSEVPTLAEAAGKRTAKKWLICADMWKTPFIDQAVDFTVCLNVYVYNPPEIKRGLLEELTRITKRGLVVDVGNEPIEDRFIKIWPQLKIPQSQKYISAGKILKDLGWHLVSSQTNDEGKTGLGLFRPSLD